MPEEARSIPARGAERRRASGAARLAARRLFREAGLSDVEIPRGEAGQPLWPEGWIGSLAHDEAMAVAALAPLGAVRALGIDVEPTLPLPEELFDLVVSPQDRLGDGDRRLAARLVFSAKEAVYKAAHPLDGCFLDYGDIAVDLLGSRASTSTGRSLELRSIAAPRIVTLAFVGAR